MQPVKVEMIQMKSGRQMDNEERRLH